MYIHMYGMQKGIKAEFACWWSACKVNKNKKRSMPQELPTSLGGQVPLQKNLSASQAPVPVSSTSSIIASSTVLTSVCETVISQASSLAGNVKSTGTIDIVVVPNSTFSTTAQIGTTTTTTQASSQYRLSEIVSREKDYLFRKDSDQDIELEPMREETLTVRRRSRQFFTVMEEDENESDESRSLAESGGADRKDKVVEIEPLFNLGDSLKNLYFPHQHSKKKSKRRKDHPKSSTSGHRHGYQSDPEGKVDLCKIIKQDPELGKQYQSHPDLSQNEKSVPFVDDYMESRKSKSLPTTPKVSPKLKRKNSLKREHEIEVHKSGPGFSFLESVAGQLHRKKIEHGKKLEQGLVKVSDGQVGARRPAEMHVDQPSTYVAATQMEPTTTIHTHHLHDFSDSAGHDLDSDRPRFMQTFLTWSTKQKVKVSNKETNMFSPSSF